MKLYTIGIATYSLPGCENLVLIQKTKPEWQAGKFNFVGGKVEENESGPDCIAREFEEEAGVRTTPESWNYVGLWRRQFGDESDRFICWIYQQHNPAFINAKTMTEEKIFHFNEYEFAHIPKDKLMSNMHWIFDFTRSPDFTKYRCHLTVEYPVKDGPEFNHA